MDSGTTKGIDYAVGIDLKELITVRAGGIEIDIPITTEETILFKIFQTAAWDTNGFWIAQKILEKGQWPWPDTVEEAREIKIDEVKMLLKGIDFFCAYEPMMFESID